MLIRSTVSGLTYKHIYIDIRYIDKQHSAHLLNIYGYVYNIGINNRVVWHEWLILFVTVSSNVLYVDGVIKRIQNCTFCSRIRLYYLLESNICTWNNTTFNCL